MVTDIVKSSWEARSCVIIKKSLIRMSPRVLSAANIMRDFLFERVYTPSASKPEAVNARETILFLWEYFKKHEDKIPPEIRRHADTAERAVTDYIASMTDQYALGMVQELRGKGGKG